MKFWVAVAAVVSVSNGIAWAEDCDKVTDPDARKYCYLDAAKAELKGGLPGKWEYMTEVSKMDDSQTVNLNLLSDGMGAVLHLRCEEKVTSLWFTMNGDFLADIEDYDVVRYRIDDLKAQKRRLDISTDNEALGIWSGKQAIPFIKGLLGHTKLTVEITPYNESPRTREFDLTGIDEAVISLRKQCGW